MIDRIQMHLLDLLAGDPKTFQGGTDYTTGWQGVRRVDGGQAASPEFVNLFDSVYDRDSSDHRPAIYVGRKGVETTDKKDTSICSGQGRAELRIAIIPLVVVASVSGQPDNRTAARSRRNQLVSNVTAVLYPHYAEAGFWYLLETPGETAGGQAQISTSMSSSGSGSDAVVEAIGTIPVVVRYSWRPGS